MSRRLHKSAFGAASFKRLKTLPCCSYSAADTGGLARSSVLVRVDPRPGSANSGSYATIADLEPLYARPCGSRASYYAASHVTHLSQVCDETILRTSTSVAMAHSEGGRNIKCEFALRACQSQVSTIDAVRYHVNNTSTNVRLTPKSSIFFLSRGRLSLRSHAYDRAPSLRGNFARRLSRIEKLTGLWDIAARNCLIEPASLRVRLADAALARDLFPQDYHCLGDNENRPIRWMALESLQHNQYSTATDVWSFGVFLWELATLGQQPYVEVDPFEMMACLRDGYRLAQPRPCPDELFAVMAVCWLGLSRDRPTMPQLLAYLQDFHVALGGFI
ncbi:Tyrosine-protein kinase RYK [Harpegnathos saltator]|uniref:Tyrosine-protein kinase RYK n=1 Tax=Harpegnathos saltator TaxID=610380 RepID=E2BV00_HARSA|nr:Tyrosine-protein kinase RYK [Harpegnathos saltator]